MDTLTAVTLNDKGKRRYSDLPKTGFRAEGYATIVSYDQWGISGVYSHPLISKIDRLNFIRHLGAMLRHGDTVTVEVV